MGGICLLLPDQKHNTTITVDPEPTIHLDANPILNDVMLVKRLFFKRNDRKP